MQSETPIPWYQIAFSGKHQRLKCMYSPLNTARVFVAAMYEVPYPSVDPILSPFFPVDDGDEIVSHFQDFGPTSPPLDLVSEGIIPSIATILYSIQHVGQLVTLWKGYPAPSIHLVMLTRMCHLLSHLLSLQPITASLLLNPESSSSQTSARISECARLAMCLHVFTAWRGLPPDGTLAINHLMHQLIASLRALLSTSGYATNTIMMWISAVGGVSALDMPERAWFVSHLAEMTEDMGIESWSDMRSCVSKCIWNERLLGKAHKELWDEVEVKRGKLALIEVTEDLEPVAQQSSTAVEQLDFK